MSGMTNAPDVFAQTFAAWNIVLPADAVAQRRDGVLRAAGCQIRFRWHLDGSLEYRAGHRMTSERWVMIAPDGAVEHLPVPAEFMVTPPDATDEAMDATGVGVEQ